MALNEEQTHYLRYRSGAVWEPAANSVIAEANITLTVNGEAWLSFACTPIDLEALAVGFLYNEGFIQGREAVGAAVVCHGGTIIDMWLHHPVARPQNWLRTSGCTGGFTAASQAQTPAVVDQRPINPDLLLEGMEQLSQAQELYRETGGVHCSAISDGRTIQVRAEDIGRHNTLDKLAGKLLLNNLHVEPVILLTTGRISADMLQKSARLGASVVVSRTSPTSQSVALAETMGITLVGYARRNSFLVYTHPERLKPPQR